MMASIFDVRFEHYRAPNTLGVDDTAPRLSWKLHDPGQVFQQSGFEVECLRTLPTRPEPTKHVAEVSSTSTTLVTWPFEPLASREKVSVRVRAYDGHHDTKTAWSEPTHLETGLLQRNDWQCQRIAAPWGPETKEPDPEQLYRKPFPLRNGITQARLYITAQGLYEAEINGERIGDYFLAPGWTSYEGRLQYQTYDVTAALVEGTSNCIGVRVAEGWFSGRIGFEGGHRNIWGPHTALLVQLEVTFADGNVETVVSDASWTVTKGPMRQAEIYDGEKYDATQEIALWSTAAMPESQHVWEPVLVLEPLPASTSLVAGWAEPVRRVETVQPLGKMTTPSGKTIIDFGQNLVGYVRLKAVKGPRGHKITLRHAEVLEGGELGTRPLRICKATDQYTLKGSAEGEIYEPRFTFHGFRYAQIDNWPGEDPVDLAAVEAVVCHTDMATAGSFTCSDPLLNKLYQNVRWSTRGNFFSVPTDCPQRDERLGWSGDLALFAPTAVLVYDCFNIVQNWLVDLEYDQHVLNGVPPMVSPNATIPDPKWCRRVPCAIWHDVTILAPWALYQETGDTRVLERQYDSMMTWMKVLPRGKDRLKHLWDPAPFQLGVRFPSAVLLLLLMFTQDWLDPAAPPEAPWKAATNARMIANMFLIQSLELMGKISGILGREAEKAHFNSEVKAAREEFHDEYVTRNGLITSDSQAAYALAICFRLLDPHQQERAATRLVELVRKNEFKIGTGFAGTPYLCEALALTGHVQVAYAMLLEKGCPSWLYPVTMGATTTWERWDSMLPDGSINPGQMTSFNHYAFGAVAKFLYERVGGLQRLEPGWTKVRIAPAMGAEFARASASHETPNGRVSCEWQTTSRGEGTSQSFKIWVAVPYGVSAEVVLPSGKGEEVTKVVGAGEWTFESDFERAYKWPILPLPPKS